MFNFFLQASLIETMLFMYRIRYNMFFHYLDLGTPSHFSKIILIAWCFGSAADSGPCLES